jgi:nucleotide-binding universal stress UspA family protein
MTASTGKEAKLVVVVGVDLSPISRDVLRTAATLCTAPGSELHLVHVLPVPPGESILGSRGDRTVKVAKQLEQARGELDRLAADVIGSVKRAAGHLAVGSPDVEIAQIAGDLGADVIVVGTHGHRGLERLLLGSVAESLVRNAPCSVVTYRPKVTPVWEKIEPPCPECLATREKTGRTKLWCERHSEHHPKAHTHYEYPENFGMGSMSFR